MLQGFECIETGLTSTSARFVRPVHDLLKKGLATGARYTTEEIRRYFLQDPEMRELMLKQVSWGPILRGVIHFLRERGYPICSSCDGYWWATSLEDFNQTIAHLQQRENSIRSVREEMENLRDIYVRNTSTDTHGQHLLFTEELR